MVSYLKRDDIGIVEFNDPGSKVNLLSSGNLAALKRIIRRVIRIEKSIRALFFISGKRGIFIAGADIKELAAIRTKEEARRMCSRGQDLFNEIERLAMPTFAVVDGACIGGGLELALSCDYILATKNKKVRLGLPEVTLGIAPGFGGPHRLAERIGTKKRDALINTGRLITAMEARRLNLVDRIIPESKQFLYQGLLDIHRQRKAAAWPFERGNKNRVRLDRLEREDLAEKILKEPARNSLSSYLLVDRYKGYSRRRPGGLPIRHCTILGAGTMGRDIAYLISSEADLPVSVKDISKKGLKTAGSHIKGIYKDAVKRGILDHDKARSGFKNISFDKNGLFKDTDIVIESITEDTSLKKSVFAEIEQALAGDCILATNTSCISVEELSKSLKNAGRFLGMHFFNPAYKMKLVEVVPTRFTSRKALERSIDFLRRLRRIPIIVKDSPGFLVNRMLLPYLNEAIFMLQDGFSPKDIEAAMLGFGMPMGPLQLLKEIGLEVAYKASRILEEGFGARMRVPDMLKERSIQGLTRRASFTTRPSQDIVDRLLRPMRREAGLCLEEGVVDNREIIDLALLLGAGFPRSKRIW